MKDLYLIGNAHIDPVWLWSWQEGYHEVKATFLSALDRLDEYDGFLFTCACAQYYAWLEQDAQPLFQRVKKEVARGRICLVGGMWIQPDLNIPSGESLVRQLLVSQRYFLSRFGHIAITGYNVDSFGQSGMLAMLYKKAGMKNYVWMRPGDSENPDIPQGAFRLKSVDGSEVLSFRIPSDMGAYTCKENIAGKIDFLRERAKQTGAAQMVFYGVGNHGGGPTKKLLNEIESLLPKQDDVCYGTPDAYFDAIAPLRDRLPAWEGEMQHHASGCYSTFSLGKLAGRRAENALVRTEKAQVLADRLLAVRADTEALGRAWEDVLFNQFHDIQCGCCIYPALEDSLKRFGEAETIADREENRVLQRVSFSINTAVPNEAHAPDKENWLIWGRAPYGTPLVMFNPHPFDCMLKATVHATIAAAENETGDAVFLQKIRAERTNVHDKYDTLVYTRVPAMGYTTVMLHEGEPAPEEASPLRVTQTTLENGRLRARFDEATGSLASLALDGRESLSAPARLLLMVIAHVDTWAHNVFAFDREIGAIERPAFTILEDGPVRASLRVVRTNGRTTVSEIYRLYRDGDQLEVDVRLDFHEHYAMLKLEVPVACASPAEIAEIPLGVQARKMTGNEEPCQRWCALSGSENGLAILNTGKFSYSAKNGALRLTLANGSQSADHNGRDERDDTVEFLDQGVQRFTYALCPFAGGWADAGLNRRAEILNQPGFTVAETYHKGPLPRAYTGARPQGDEVVLECLKLSEDGAGYIVRLREPAGRTAHGMLRLPLLSADIPYRLSPFDMKTWFVSKDGGIVREVLITELPLET